MEVNVDKSIFTDVIKMVSRAISPNPVIPSLSGVLLIAEKDGLVITGSDSDLSIRTIIRNDCLEIIEEGSIILPAKELLKIARSMPNNLISIKSVNELQVKISSGKSKFTLNGINGNNYFNLPEMDGESFTVKGITLKESIEKTVYAVSKSETRPILTGVNIFFENEKLGMVATDGHRLSKIINGNIEGVLPTKEITIPEKTLKELPTIIDNSKEVIIMPKDNQIVFQTEDIYVLSRLLTGNFPETNRLIPLDYKTLLTVDRRDFLSSIERSAILADSESSVTLKISDKNSGIFETVELSHNNGELGHSTEDIIVDQIEGDEIIISFNPKYMIDALKRVDNEKIAIEFNGAMRPFIIKPLEGNSFIQLVLPVRTI